MFNSNKVIEIIPATDWWFVTLASHNDYKVQPVASWGVVERKSNFKTKTYVEGLGVVENDSYISLVEDYDLFKGYVRAKSETEALKKAKELY